MPVELITKEDLQQAIAPLLLRIKQLEAGLDQYLDTDQACKLLGISRDTIERERVRGGTLLVPSYRGRKPTYSRASLLAYAASKNIVPYDHAQHDPEHARQIKQYADLSAAA